MSGWSASDAASGPFERTPLDEALAATPDWWRREHAAGAARPAA